MTGSSDPADDGANSAAIDAAVVERVAAEHGVGTDELAALVTVVGADRTDAHHEYETDHDHATVDDRRVYALDEAAWDEVIEANDAFDLAEPLRVVHREQAELLLDAPPEQPLVVGIDTAEEPDEVPRQYEE